MGIIGSNSNKNNKKASSTTNNNLKRNTSTAKKKKKKHNNSVKFTITMIFVLIAAFMFGFSIKIIENFITGNPTPFSFEINKTVSSDNKEPNNDLILQQKPKVSEDYLNSITFIGDSITHGAMIYKYIDESHTFAENGINHVEAQTKAFVDIGYPYKVTLESALKKKKPEKIIFLMGINGIAWMNKTEFFEEYENIVNLIIKSSPKSQIILESILPVADFYVNTDNRINNKKIDEYNKTILEIAKKYKLHYLDTASVFKDNKNNIKTSYQSGDGMHLSNKGYEAMFDYILTHPLD